MPRLNPVFLTILTGLLSWQLQHHANAQTLEEAVHLMLKHEPELRAIDYGSQSSFQDWKIARGGLLRR